MLCYDAGKVADIKAALHSPVAGQAAILAAAPGYKDLILF